MTVHPAIEDPEAFCKHLLNESNETILGISENLTGPNETIFGTSENQTGRNPCEFLFKNYRVYLNATIPTPKENGLDITKLIVLALVTIFTVVGNFVVILSILLRRGKVTRMYYFILHLSIADLFTAFFTLIPEFAWTFTLPKFYGGNVACKLMKYFFVIGPYLSSYTLVMTAVDRYQAICYPLSNLMSHHRSVQKSYMLGIAWILSILFGIPQLFIYRTPDDRDVCFPKFYPNWGKQAYVVYYALSNFVIPFIVILFCYSKMCAVLWGNFKQKKAQEKADLITISPERQGDTTTHHENTTEITPLDKKNGGFDDTELQVLDDSSAKSTKNVETNTEMPKSKNFKLQVGQNLKLTILKGGDRKKSHQRPEFDEIAIVGDKNGTGNGNGNTVTTGTSTTTPETFRTGSTDLVTCPRIHSTKAISNAKIKTVKLTVVVVAGFLICSAPFTCVWLYVVFAENHASNSFVSMYFKWCFYLMTLNSGVNPWIYMAFNPELIPWHRSNRRARDAEMNSMYRRHDTAVVQFRRRESQECELTIGPRIQDNELSVLVEPEDKNSPVTITKNIWVGNNTVASDES